MSSNRSGNLPATIITLSEDAEAGEKMDVLRAKKADLKGTDDEGAAYYTPYNLMLMLDSQILEALEDQWKKEPEGLTLAQFVWLMQCSLPHSSKMKRTLYDGLIQLFNDIDINGDRRLEWDEFTRYITDSVISQKKIELLEDQPATDGMLAGGGNVEDFNLDDNIKIEKAYSKSTKAYSIDTSSMGVIFNDQVVKANKIMSDYKYLVLVNQDNHLKIIDITTYRTVQTIKIPAKHRLRTTMLLDFDNCDKSKTVAALSSDKKFFFWIYSNVEVPQLTGEMDILMVNIRHIPDLDLWVTNSNGPYFIRLWKFDGSKLIEKTSKINHDNKLTGMFFVGLVYRDRKVTAPWNH